LRGDVLAGAAGAPGVGGAGDRVRVAALDHEAGDDAVELRAVVEALLREVDEVFHVVRRGVGVEADVDLTGGGVQLRDLVLVVLHRSILLGRSFRRGIRFPCPLLAARYPLKLSAPAELAPIRGLFAGTLLLGAAEVRAEACRLAVGGVPDEVAALQIGGAAAVLLADLCLARPSSA